jgi:hypothetical protein
VATLALQSLLNPKNKK